MSNSSLTNITNISPNKTSPRNHKIDTITIHVVVGQLSVERIGEIFKDKKKHASCNYAIGSDGRVLLCVDEADRSWCSSNADNDNRAITIECASDATHPFAINHAVYNKLIELCADICKRNNITELKWEADKALIGQPNKQNLTVHRWFANKACPGDYIYNRLGQIAKEVNSKISAVQTPAGITSNMLDGLSPTDLIKTVGPLCTEDQKESGVLASITLAQFILERGWNNNELAKNANNCFGMKVSLSGNTWSGSTWDGISKYTKITKEYRNNEYVEVSADFRKYPTINKSIGDHSAYLVGAMKGSKKRYEGIVGNPDARKTAQILKDGSYATDPEYVNLLCSLITKWKLDEYNIKTNNEETVDVISLDLPSVPFTVQIADDLKYYKGPSVSSGEAGRTGKGIFTIVETKDNWGKLKSGVGWIYLYGLQYNPQKPPETPQPFTVFVSIGNLRIRTGAGSGYAPTGFYTGIGRFTIMEVKPGIGSSTGWGRLKSGAGWISMDHTKRV